MCPNETFLTVRQIWLQNLHNFLSTKRVFSNFDRNKQKLNIFIRQKQSGDKFALNTDVLIARIKRGHCSPWPCSNKKRNLATSVWKKTETNEQSGRWNHLPALRFVCQTLKMRRKYALKLFKESYSFQGPRKDSVERRRSVAVRSWWGASKLHYLLCNWHEPFCREIGPNEPILSSLFP